jgi:hypothetical protein
VESPILKKLKRSLSLSNVLPVQRDPRKSSVALLTAPSSTDGSPPISAPGTIVKLFPVAFAVRSPGHGDEGAAPTMRLVVCTLGLGSRPIIKKNTVSPFGSRLLQACKFPLTRPAAPAVQPRMSQRPCPMTILNCAGLHHASPPAYIASPPAYIASLISRLRIAPSRRLISRWPLGSHRAGPPAHIASASRLTLLQPAGSHLASQPARFAPVRRLTSLRPAGSHRASPPAPARRLALYGLMAHIVLVRWLTSSQSACSPS